MGSSVLLGVTGVDMSRAELIERILFAVDGYRFGEWSLIDVGARIAKLIEQNMTEETLSGNRTRVALPANFHRRKA